VSGRSTKGWRHGCVFLVLLCVETVWATSGGTADNPIAASQNPHGPLKMACQNCHNTTGWMPLRSQLEFDHNRTAYPLRGMHTKVPCEECHVDPVFASAGRNCQDCHADIHRRRNGAQCDMCHRVNGWQVSVHNINEHQDRFPLIGAHAAVDCYACHKAGAIGQFNRQGLSTECVSCHLKAFQTATSPNHRTLGFSMDCRQCHNSMDSWLIVASARTKARKR
jgi:hypothetical protein